jgi:nitrate reductase alpha subunit
MMDKERAIEELELLKGECGDDWLSPKQYFDRVLALDMGIKSLKQEDVLDNIRERIVNFQKMFDDENDLNMLNQYSLLGMVLEIIDEEVNGRND